MDFTTLYETHYNRVFAVSLQILRDKQLAEDNAQETFLKAFKKSKMLETVEKVGAWLAVIATRTAIDTYRKESKTKGFPLEGFLLESLGATANSYVETEVEAELLKNIIQDSLVLFSAEDKRILELKLKKGWKEKDIAKALQMNPSTVKSKIHRAKCKLKERLLKELKVA